MYGLTNDEIEYLKNCDDDIKKSIDTHDTLKVLSAMNTYLVSEDCLFCDSREEYWYTEKGHYIQSLYDKIILWTYEDEDDDEEYYDKIHTDMEKELFERLAR